MTQRTRVTSHVAVAIVVLGGLASCGGGGGVVASGQAQVSDFAAKLGRCETEVREGPNIYEYLASPGAWFAVSDATHSKGEEELDPSSLTATLDLIGADAPFTEASRTLVGPDQVLGGSEPMVRMVDEAVDEADETYVKVAFDGPEPDILYSVAFSGDEFAFVGNCKAVRYTEPIVERYGEGATELVRSLVGATEADTRRILEIDPDPELPGTSRR